jgi:hypothetical protein
MDRDGRAIVDYPGNPYGPLSARRTATVSRSMLEEAHRESLAVLLVFEDHDPGFPVVFDMVVDHAPAAHAAAECDPRIAQHNEPPVPPVASQGEAWIGRIVQIRDGSVFVAVPGDAAGPRPARTTVALRNLKDDVLVVSAGGQFIIVGQLYGDIPVAPASGDSCDVVLRGKSIRIEAEDEVVVAAGSSRLHLDARGKAVTTADSIVSRARTVNKVQGGCVKLN